VSDALPILSASWPAPRHVLAFTTLRGGVGQGASPAPFDTFNLGAHCGDSATAVAANRARLRAIGDLPGEPHWLRQVHGTRVLRFGPDAGGVIEPEADAASTATPGEVLVILSADCLPVLLCATNGSEVAAAHAGWRGLAGGVLERTVDAMDTSPEHLLAWLGPAAGPQAYEVGVEVRDAFLAHDPRAGVAFVPTRPGHWRVDLYALARQRLAEAGVTQVFGGGRCTLSEPDHFFSHRRDGRSGRMATLIWIAA
jgi:YfiH family protein